MIIDRQPQELFHDSNSGSPKLTKSKDIHLESGSVDRAKREASFGHKAVTMWCTGLSGSGKSTIAKALEERLFADGRPVYRLDGDNLRFGLNRNLGFSKEDRRENIRRAAEVAKLFNDAGISVICSLISPMREDRQRAREVIGDSFFEIYLSTPLVECEKRDPHGLYKKARTGEIKEFTGISAPYEAPESPELEIDTAKLSVEQCLDKVLKIISK
jgi:bifunctional enzyme CysN/CysC